MKRFYVQKTLFDELFIAETREPKYKMRREGFEVFNTYEEAQKAALTTLGYKLQRVQTNIARIKRRQGD